MAHLSIWRRLFIIGNYIFLGLIVLSIFIPLWNIVVTSFATDEDVLSNSFLLIPQSFTLEHYKSILASDYIKGFFNSLKMTLLGVGIGLPLTIGASYALSREELPFRLVFLRLLVVTMIIEGGIIPMYLLIKGLGLMGTHAAVYLPLAINAYNIILMTNYMRNIPNSLIESARIDGATEWIIIFKIIVPVSIPIIAAVGLFYTVGIWNNYFYSMMFISDVSKTNIQVMLRSLIIENNSSTGSNGFGLLSNFKMAVMIMGVLPVIILYPFIQRFFISGIMLGSVKG